eukprot:CAMPEP_0197037782 /NCGR_PEP_ID=MMETSP1384-20130603/14905_1 /TAXON_ID=29189 /ORGANISM="Ammonia sp." /LENGTH=52 /DNA_ID=CAMNT_0042468133 /DNA_START=129 /DNA_END=287 /DNA_ORIENTATION=+
MTSRLFSKRYARTVMDAVLLVVMVALLMIDRASMTVSPSNSMPSSMINSPSE